jgi:hypothetical protein
VAIIAIITGIVGSTIEANGFAADSTPHPGAPSQIDAKACAFDKNGRRGVPMVFLHSRERAPRDWIVEWIFALI